MKKGLSITVLAMAIASSAIAGAVEPPQTKDDAKARAEAKDKAAKDKAAKEAHEAAEAMLRSVKEKREGKGPKASGEVEKKEQPKVQ
ncbi:hypothetical protein [Massilia sp. TS11]|uniref:hypothetical protein n=1 Tax=Massilia sp. TS11 TaxID=2908003 RepID=UPI001EDA2760|nr:hypothetical protein [Massilia sp. TS11]MCG2583864.1 hypothetical protein [Massilia sp. TS11]